MREELIEELAAYAHTAWSLWMEYLFSRCDSLQEGMLIPTASVERWTRQMSTPYKELPYNEQESDRLEAREILEIIKRVQK